MPFSSQPLKATYYQDVTTDVGLDHLAEVVFVRFPHCKVTLSSPLSILPVLERKSLCEAHTYRAGVMVYLTESKVST